MIDCVQTSDTAGCTGGIMTDAFQWVLEHGIMNDTIYPYEAVDDKRCRYSSRKSVGTCSSFVEIPSGSESELEKAVKEVGPVAVGLEASHPSMQFYSEGIYFEPRCDPTNLNHAVLVVGYGTEKGQDYWILKNSWGSLWGGKRSFELLLKHLLITFVFN